MTKTTDYIIRDVIRLLQGTNKTSVNITVTELCRPCLRQAWYKRYDTTNIQTGDFMPRVMGSGIHSILQINGLKINPEDNEYEKYVKLQMYDGGYISGIIDRIIDNRIIIDYKFTKNIPASPYMSYIEQLNIYDYMLHKISDGYSENTELYLVYISHEGIIKVLSVPKLKDIGKIITQRYHLLRNAEVVPPHMMPVNQGICGQCAYVNKCVENKK